MSANEVISIVAPLNSRITDIGDLPGFSYESDELSVHVKPGPAPAAIPECVKIMVDASDPALFDPVFRAGEAGGADGQLLIDRQREADIPVPGYLGLSVAAALAQTGWVRAA
ncbi:hypothetical protein [Kitasatospora sp. NPDC001175]|uniref:hypothetical protein n=1 Tax=Kitasatospora sp. NPDC001175 TaxID=3157103 RepID=UPI003CFF7B6B